METTKTKSHVNTIVLIFTRYLYIKSNVIKSLQVAIEMYDYESALFWAYELYYSGFEYEVFDILFTIYESRYAKDHPKMGEYMKKKKNEYIDASTNKKDTIVATIIKNMMKKNDIPEINNPRFVAIQESQIDRYKTKELTHDNWKYLSIVCEKSVFKIKMSKKTETKILDIFRDKWLFCASFSPIWKKRIHEYNGKIIGRTSDIIFDSDDDFDKFYDRYNYETDEQSLEIQKKCMGIL